MKTYDVVVIGGGPGGYSAAVRASQLGFRTALVEKEHMGGTCLNWGCIPTKSLLKNAEVINLLSKGRTYGFSIDNLEFDYAVAHKRSRTVVTRQTRRVALLMKNKGITVYEGKGRLKSPTEVAIEPSGEVLQATHIILATGAVPRPLPGVQYDGRKIITSKDALNLTQVPKKAIIVGAGAIGMEFATIWNRYGVDVTVLEMLPHVLPLEDEEISLEAVRQFKRNRIKVHCETQVRSVATSGDTLNVTVQSGETTEVLAADTVLISIGVMANSEGLGLEEAGVETDRGRVSVNAKMQSSQPNIYAIGDLTGKMPLAHVASTQAIIAAEAIAGRETPELSYADIPRCTYANPEVASVGLTEKQAREQGFDVETAQCQFAANGKAMAMDDNSGFVKIVSNAADKKILGVHMIGGHVTEMIAGPTGMITLETNAEDYGRVVHPHPTLSEAVMEAVHALCGHAIHI